MVTKLIALIFMFALVVSNASAVFAADLQAGRLKTAKCRNCHGINGIARIPYVPDITGVDQTYLESELRAFRSGELQNVMMSRVAKDLSDNDISDLAAWYSSVEPIE